MTGFLVDYGQLAIAGQRISELGSSSSGIAEQIEAAEVPNLAWGLLGVSCGLFEMYLSMLADLKQHLADMGRHLDQTGSAMIRNAQAYQQIEEQIAQAMRQLHPGTVLA